MHCSLSARGVSSSRSSAIGSATSSAVASYRPRFHRGCSIHKQITHTALRAVIDSSEGAAFEADVIQASKTTPVLVDFWATWCGPCKLVAPSMVWADGAYDGQLRVVKIDCTDGNKELMEKYKVYGLPCLIVFKDGEVVESSHREGAITKKALAEYIEENTGLKASAV